MVITTERIHFIKDIKLKENPFKEHLITEYIMIIKKIMSNTFKLFEKYSKKS